MTVEVPGGSNANDQKVQNALDGMQGAAAGQGAWRTHDPAVRASYGLLIRAFRRRIWAQYKAGKLGAEEAAKAASEARNFILEVTRAVSTPAGRKAAVEMKRRGRSFEDVLDIYSKRLFQKPFESLSETERTRIFEEAIQGSARTSREADAAMRSLAATSRLFWMVTILMAVYDISSARDKVRATVHDLEIVGSAVVVGDILGGVIGSFAGPVGTGVGVVVGGILGGWLVDHFLYRDADPALTGSRG